MSVSDILEDGRDRPPLPRWVRVATAVALVLVAGVYGLTELRGGQASSPPSRPAPPGPASSPVPGASQLGQGGALGTVGPWQLRAGACGTRVLTPRSTARPSPQPTGLRVLAGGPRLVEADFDTGAVTVIASVSAASQVPWLAAARQDLYYTVAATCQPPQSPERLMRLAEGSRPEPVQLSGSIDDVIAGAGQVWGVHNPERVSEQVVLHRPGGATLRLPAGIRPVGVAQGGVVGLVRRIGATALPRRITMIDTATGRMTAVVPAGWPLAVGADFVLWQEERCRWRTVGCVLHRTGLPRGEDRGRFPLTTGSAPTSDAVLDNTGRYAAFTLARPADRQNRASLGEVVVLDLASGVVRPIPGLVLPPDTAAGLAFSPDGRWLVVSVTHGDHGHMYAWRHGSDQLVRSRARLPGPLRSAPPVLVLPSTGES